MPLEIKDGERSHTCCPDDVGFAPHKDHSDVHLTKNGFFGALPIMILVVDDDTAYEILLPILFKKSNSPVGLKFVFDGEQAMDYLTGKGKFADRNQFPLPKMILLDIKMPKVDGFDFLEWKRNQPVFDHLPVVMWSSSDLPQDKAKAAELGAVDYIVKPVVGHDLLKALERIYERLTEARANAAKLI